MPYIKSEFRPYIDRHVEMLDNPIQTEGDLNYAITRLALRFIQRKGLSYATLSTTVGTLRLVANEIETRLVKTYEYGKRYLNGDVPEYEELEAENIKQFNAERKGLCYDDLVSGPTNGK